MLIHRFFVRRLTCCLEVTGSFDEYLSVANEKGWERKLPLIRSWSDIFLIECHCSYFHRSKDAKVFVRQVWSSWVPEDFPWLPLCVPSTYPILAPEQVGSSWGPQSWPAASLAVWEQPSRYSSGVPAHVCRAYLFLCFMSLLGPAGNEPWPAASSGRKAAKQLPAENTVC